MKTAAKGAVEKFPDLSSPGCCRVLVWCHPLGPGGLGNVLFFAKPKVSRRARAARPKRVQTQKVRKILRLYVFFRNSGTSLEH